MGAADMQRLDVLEAEVAELRRAVELREAFIEATEARAYARGRESILGGSSGRPARTPQAERWLHAVPEPQPELEAGA
jgi:hypothetical protein